MRQGKTRLLRLALAALLAAALFWALCAAFAAAGGLRDLCGGGYGIRAAMPLDEARRESARKAAADLGADIAFWGEAQSAVQAKKDGLPPVETKAEVVVCAGEPALALGARYRYGRAPAAGENGACAVSLPLAAALWGGQDVTGQTVTSQGRDYTVCGVAEGEERWLLCPDPAAAPAGVGLTGIQLAGLPAGDPRAAAQGIARAAGLDESGAVLVSGGTLAAAAELLAWLPLALAGAALAGRAAALGLRRLGAGAARQGAMFAAALAFALALPRLLAALPPWLIPNRWSDAAFWRDLLALPAATLQGLLAAPSTVPDVALQHLLLQSAAAGLAALLCAGALLLMVQAGSKDKRRRQGRRRIGIFTPCGPAGGPARWSRPAPRL